ncbi:MAG: glycerophosphodiester phosphodiesterase [Lentisphaerae bacterium]|nr:glycerophosphodiester phosphodiesterase [Lentisphaerota bacterium]
MTPPARAAVLLAAGLAGAAGAADRPLVIAHRGASGYLPEHTLAAKALAVGMGADAVEQDLVLSRDGVPVVSHDVQIDTVTDVAGRFPARARADGRFYAIDFTVAELRQLAVNERIVLKSGQPAFPGRYPAGPSPLRIVTFEEELRFIRGLSKSAGRAIGIYPELKQPKWHREQGRDLAAAVLPLLTAYGYATEDAPCHVQCFEFDELRRVRGDLGYRGRLVYLFGAEPKEPTLEEVARVADGIGPSIKAVVAAGPDGAAQVTDLVRRAHALGLVVHPYTARADELPPWAKTIDDVHRRVLVEAGADGLFTDFPDLTAAFVRRK